MATDETRNAVAHLLRRAAFGGRADEIDALAEGGYEAAVDAVCDFTTPDAAADAVTVPEFDTAAYLAARDGTAEERRAAGRAQRAARRGLLLWALRRMAEATQAHREKTTLLWHDHFATSLQKVKLPELMYVQWQTLHELGHGRFDDLAAAMVRDPAMLIWLDGRESTAKAPNENFAREFFELFTLGHGGAGGHGGGLHGGQPYTEGDVAEAARAFTGWTLRRGATTSELVPRRHDSGTKTILGSTGDFGADDVVRLAVTHDACAPHVVARLWSRVARPAEPDDPVVRELAADFAADRDIAALRRRMFLHPEFLASPTRTALIKQPIEYVVGAARALGVRLEQPHLLSLVALGQVPFLPPDVSGWPANEAWLSTSTALARMQFADAIAAAADIDEIAALPAAERPEAFARTLGVDEWSPETRTAMASADDPRAALTMALVSPEYVLA